MTPAVEPPVVEPPAEYAAEPPTDESPFKYAAEPPTDESPFKYAAEPPAVEPPSEYAAAEPPVVEPPYESAATAPATEPLPDVFVESRPELILLDTSTTVPSMPVADAAGFSDAADGPADEMVRLISVVEHGGPEAAEAAEILLNEGDPAAIAVAQFFPGPLRFGHRKLHNIGLPAAEHGPLIELATRFGDRIVNPLVPLLSDPAPDVRFHAALVLGSMRSEAAVAPLGELLFDADAAVRRMTNFALSSYPLSPEVEALFDRLRGELDSDDIARVRAATFALGELRDVSSVPQLVDMLKHGDTEAVDLAHRALVLITKQDLGTTRWRWRRWWERARTLSRAEWLLEGLDDARPEVQRSAAEELAVILTDRFGAHASLSWHEREEASRRFTSWERQHPGALGDADRS